MLWVYQGKNFASHRLLVQCAHADLSMRHKDCEVFLKCDGRVLDEYDTEMNGDCMSCYVASEAGKVSGFPILQEQSVVMTVRHAHAFGLDVLNPIQQPLAYLHKRFHQGRRSSTSTRFVLSLRRTQSDGEISRQRGRNQASAVFSCAAHRSVSLHAIRYTSPHLLLHR